MVKSKRAAAPAIRPGRTRLGVYLARNWQLYAMLIPVIAFYILFCYVPYGGLVIAFKDFRLANGIWGSPWVGLKHFQMMFSSGEFWRILRNSVFLNVLNVLIYFPVPIFLAIMLNEVRNQAFKKIAQSMMYLPYFFSWVVLGGMVVDILSPGTGVVNLIIKSITGGDGIFFLASKFWWPLMFVLSSIWKDAGWGSIIYLAAISGINPELYEAATVDGAGKLRQILHITIPGIMPTIIIMLILRMGGMVDVGLEQVMMLENAAVSEISDVISTYTYRIGVLGFQYSLTTAIGVFQSLISVVLMLMTNALARRYTDGGIW